MVVQWYCNIEVVDSFNYLETVFCYTGSFNLNEQFLSGKGLKALNNLMNNCKKLRFRPKICCQLIDAFVGSILSYSAEVWGFTNYKSIERLHLKFRKYISKISKINYSTVGVYSELGRYPLYISHWIKIVKYWLKLLQTDNIILRKVYNQAVSDCNTGSKNWVYNLKDILYKNGYGYIWENPININSSSFINRFKHIFINCFIQDWSSSKDENRVLNVYKQCKEVYGYESYLDILPDGLRAFLTRIRISAHCLQTQSDRQSRIHIPQNERYCQCCNSGDIEDEYYFMLICPCFRLSLTKNCQLVSPSYKVPWKVS